MIGTWRKANREFPEDGHQVLCLIELRNGERRLRIGTHYIVNSVKDGHWYIGGRDNSVIAWMTLPEIPEGEIPLKATVQDAESKLKDCVNELCLHCGAYQREHEGACDGCRWKKMKEELT